VPSWVEIAVPADQESNSTQSCPRLGRLPDPTIVLGVPHVKTSVETIDATTVKLTVEVPAADLKSAMDAAYKYIADQVSVPGFRRGKVPSRIIDQRIGRSVVVEHAVNEALPDHYEDAVAAEKLPIVGQPEIDIVHLPFLDPEDDGALEFTAQVEVRPEFSIPDVSDLTLEIDSMEVTDDDVADELTKLRERFGTLIGVDRPAAEGDFVVIDLTANIDGVDIDSASGVSYQIGSGDMLEGLDEALTGLSADETTTFASTLAGGEFRGQDAEITVTATAVKTRELPDADDDFAQLASEFDTLEELRESLRKEATKSRGLRLVNQAQVRLLDHLLENTDIPVPEKMLASEIERHLESEGRTDDDQHREEVAEQTIKALRTQFLLDVLAETKGVQVSRDELLNYILTMSRQFSMDSNAFLQMIGDQNQLAGVAAEVARGKALTTVLRGVNLVDPSGAPVDLSEHFGDEPDAEGSEFVDVDLDAVDEAEIGADSADSSDSAPSAPSANE
jgi:trigger factor